MPTSEEPLGEAIFQMADHFSDFAEELDPFVPFEIVRPQEKPIQQSLREFVSPSQRRKEICKAKGYLHEDSSKEREDES